ncbi:MAG: YggS family pyridoxal phosphate-dependent enzyme [Myxococcota bacterium]|nr:YggS family pyridoxal phosphate-dependent enzyme [Myxococcota bacterium]
MTVAERLAEVRLRIEHAERRSGRPPGSVRLLAVSKRHSETAIREAYAAGQRVFGESYAQELEAKSNALTDLSGIEWHFIGHLQTNKAKLVARHAHTVHTVDSVVLAGELGKRAGQAGRVLPVLVEVNVGGEAQKAGAAASEIREVMDSIRAQPFLDLRGLMTMPPAGDLVVARRVFETLATLRNIHGGDRVLPELSIGMSADLEVAIACGATLVRVGTGVFGAR